MFHMPPESLALVNRKLAGMRRAVRAVHARYKDKCAEVVKLRAEVACLEREVARQNLVITAQMEITRLAEQVLGLQK